MAQLVAGTGAIALLGLWACDGSGVPPAYRSTTIPELRLVSAEAQARGRVLFQDHCALCHGERADGLGRRRSLSVPAADFTDPTWRARVTPRRVYFVIREGIRGTPMPAWKALDDDEIWDLVAYVLSVGRQVSEH